MSSFIGIDPGLDGAIAVIAGSEILALDRTPWFHVYGKKKKREYNLAAMRGLLDGWQKDTRLVCLELVHAMPGQGVCSMFGFGRGLGLWEGLLSGLGFKYEMITPQRWQKAILEGMPKGKGSSIAVAQRLFNRAELRDGQADALLLAEYGRRIERTGE